MQVVKAVVLDLMDFALESLLGVVRRLLPAHTAPLALPDVRDVSQLKLRGAAPITDTQTSSKALTATPSRPHTPAAGLLAEHRYVGETAVQLHLHPTITFDGVLMTVPYGAEVTVHRFEGRFALISYETDTGWVLKDALYPAIEMVQPQLVAGMTYDYDNQETEKLRQCISDEFSGAAAQVSLSSAEHVTYRLQRAHRTVPWGHTRPRLPGVWQQLLRGVRGVHVSIGPKTGSVMEYQYEQAGQLAYVEAVAPDETIRIAYISDHDDARYVEAELSKESWRELRPVFIEVL